MTEQSPDLRRITPHLEEDPGLSLDLSQVQALRPWPYVRPIVKELIPLVGVVLAFTVLSIPFGMMAMNLIYNRMLVGGPVTPFEAGHVGPRRGAIRRRRDVVHPGKGDPAQPHLRRVRRPRPRRHTGQHLDVVEPTHLGSVY